MERSRRIITSTIVLLVVWVASFALLFVSPWGQPSLKMDVTSSAAGFAQLFVAGEDRAFTEERSTWALVTPGASSVTFPLRPWRGTVGTQLRWDPLDAPAEMVVHRMELVSGFGSEEVPLELLKPSMAVSEIIVGPEGAQFTAQSNDSQIQLEVATANLVELSARYAALGATALTAVAGAVWFAVRRRQKRYLEEKRPASEAFTPTEIPSTGARIPGWVLAGLCVIVAAGVWLLIRGSQVVGVSWDEPIHEASLGEFFRSGWFIPRGSFVDGIPRLADASVYAPVGALFGHIFGAVSGSHAWFVASFDASAYEARHLGVAVLALVGLAAVAATARMLFSNWRWSSLVVAIAVSVPLLTGHSMFNIKDAPVAGSFSIFVLGLVLVSVTQAGPRAYVISGTLLTSAIILGVGNRPGIWVAFAATFAASVVLLLLLDVRSEGARSAAIGAVRRLVLMALATVGGYAVLWIIYPIAFGNPVRILRDSLAASQAFPWTGETLTAGIAMPAQPPVAYIPLWLGAQLPLVVLLAAVIGIGWLTVAYIKAIQQADAADPSVRGAIPVALQATVVPIGAIVLGTTLYGGVRQLLFIFPAIALIAALGIRFIVTAVSTSQRVWPSRLVWSVVLIGLAIPLISQIRLFPYSFAYFNPVASVQDIDENWDVDGWWLSGRELVEDQAFPARTICVDSVERDISACSRMEMITPYLGEPVEGSVQLREDQYVALSRFPYPIGDDECTPFREVTRGLYFQEIQLSHADVCTVTLTEYPQGGISFAGLTKEDPVLLWGWTPYLLWGWGDPDAQGVWMVENSASVGFRAEVEARDSLTQISITGSGTAFGAASGSLRVFINGEDAGTIPIPAEGEDVTSSVGIPAGAISASNEGRMVVRLEAEGVDPELLAAELNAGLPGLFRIETLRID